MGSREPVLQPAGGRQPLYAWCSWSIRWEAAVAEADMCCRVDGRNDRARVVTA